MIKGKMIYEKDAVKMLMETYIANNNLKEVISRTIDELIYGNSLDDAIESEMDDMAGLLGVDINDYNVKCHIIDGIKEELTRVIDYDSVIDSIAESVSYNLNTAEEN